MDKLYIDAIFRILTKPESFQSLNAISDNIRTYGKLEFMEGYYTGQFKQFQELCAEMNDFQSVLDFIDLVHKHIKDNVEASSYECVKTHIDHMCIAILHNFNKKENRYGING